jgi:hypothetical protein
MSKTKINKTKINKTKIKKTKIKKTKVNKTKVNKMKGGYFSDNEKQKLMNNDPTFIDIIIETLRDLSILKDYFDTSMRNNKINNKTITKISFYSLMYEIPDLIYTSLKHFEMLTTLQFFNCYFFDIEKILFLKDNTIIKNLTINGNNFNKKTQHLADLLENNKSITTLDISNNEGIDFETFKDNLKTVNVSLTVLNFNNNDIGDDGAKVLSILINDKFRELIELNINSNYIGDDGAIALAEALKINKKLKHLDISNNIFGVEGAETLDNVINIHNTTLETLDISKNINLSTENINYLNNRIINSNDKTKLNISKNIINGNKPLKDKLKEINKKLVDMCDDQLSIVLDYRKKLPNNILTDFDNDKNDLILCLFRKCKSISTIVLKISSYDKTLKINSTTAIKYSNHRYNILLRALIIVLSRIFDPEIRYIKSHAVNPTSAYIQIVYFNAYPVVKSKIKNSPFSNTDDSSTNNNKNNVNSIEKEKLETLEKIQKLKQSTNKKVLYEEIKKMGTKASSNNNDKYEMFTTIDLDDKIKDENGNNTDIITKMKIFINETLLNKDNETDNLNSKKKYITCIDVD